MEAPTPRSAFQRLWDQFELTPQLLLTMARGAIPPTLGLAIYQATSIADEFQTIGYLVAIVSIISMCIQPRVPFVKSMIVSIFLTFLGVCVSLLAAYCSIAARVNTTPAGANLAAYNSSASAVSAVWLFFSVWFINTIRAYRPQFTPSIILYSIMTEISIVTTSRMSSMKSEVIPFELKFMEIFFVGHALTTSVNIFVFPTSSRSIAFSGIQNYLSGAHKVLEAEAAYVKSFENSSIFNPKIPDPVHRMTEERDFEDLKTTDELMREPHSPEARELSSALNSLSSVHTKLRTDLHLAKKDIGFAVQLDLGGMFRLLRNLILPLRGMSVLISIFQRLCEWRGWVVVDDSNTIQPPFWQLETNETLDADYRERLEWRAIFRDFREPIDELSTDMQMALRHVAIMLGLDGGSKSSKKEKGSDEEKDGAVKPGDPAFAKYYASKTKNFHQRRGVALTKWMQSKGFEATRTGDMAEESSDLKHIPTVLERNDEEQLFVILYMQHLFHGISDAILELVKFAETYSVTRPNAHKQFIVPGRKGMAKLMRNFFKEVDTSDDINASDSRIQPTKIVGVGESEGLKHDPEHLPPKNDWQAFGNYIRKISHFLSSPQSGFGLRTACAVASVSIIGLLRSTQTFFFNQRGFWAMIIIAFSMNPTSGQSLSVLLFRMIGTTAAAIIAIANWYIADGKPAGVLVVFYILLFVEMFVVVKYPQYIGIWKVAMITQSIIIGYALQTQKTGVLAPPATSSTHYPVYLIAPYRLATTAIGVIVAFFWTVFPSPATSRSLLRKRLGQSLFLLARYDSAMQATVRMWASDTQGDVKNDKYSAGRRLEKARNKIFAKELLLLASLREHRGFSKYEMSIGGDFPKQLYDKIIVEIDTILSHMNLVIYATTTSTPILSGSSPETLQTVFSNSTTGSEPASRQWLDSLSVLFSSAEVGSHNIATLLALLAASVTNGQPLPPFLEPPKPYDLARQMKRMDPQLLGLRHVEDPGYSAFAVTQVSCTMIAESLGRLLGLVKELVGEMDFGAGVGSGKSGKKD